MFFPVNIRIRICHDPVHCTRARTGAPAAMNHFEYRDGVLYAEDVPLPVIAGRVGTPFYVYATATMVRHFRVFRAALDRHRLDALVCYAVKANTNQAVIATLAAEGAGADVVSGGELARARAAGVPPGRIVFSGVGKTAEEMAQALAQGVNQINVESVPELEALSAAATAAGREAPVALRVNPDVDARTHAKITTGKAENKFGIDIADAPALYDRLATLPGLQAVGVALHIGSQLTDLAPFRTAFGHAADLVRDLRGRGHDIRQLDLGGGLGVPYEADIPPEPDAYAAMVAETVGDLGCRLIFEPGRVLVANAGVLVTRVLYVKEGRARRFVIVDAAMNDLIRPAMYDAFHAIEPVVAPAGTADLAPADVVGPVCETGDTFARDRLLPPLAAGDLVAIRSAGAYGAVMASTYNTRPLVPEVMVNGGHWAEIRPRPAVADLIALDRLPPWLAEEG